MIAMISANAPTVIVKFNKILFKFIRIGIGKNNPIRTANPDITAIAKAGIDFIESQQVLKHS